MTTPAPTTASLHREMVEALRASDAGEECWDQFDEGEPDVCQWDPVCWEHRRRAALEGWEKRPPLRQEGEMRDVVARFLVLYRRGEFAPAADVTSMLLDALEPLLYGERG